MENKNSDAIDWQARALRAEAEVAMLRMRVQNQSVWLTSHFYGNDPAVGAVIVENGQLVDRIAKLGFAFKRLFGCAARLQSEVADIAAGTHDACLGDHTPCID